jgi:hypothetical protein
MKQALARFGWRDTARGAGQEPNSQPSFEFTDGVAERRLGNAQLRCGFGEAALSPYGEKGQEVIQISALHLWPLLNGPAAVKVRRVGNRCGCHTRKS